MAAGAAMLVTLAAGTAAARNGSHNCYDGYGTDGISDSWRTGGRGKATNGLACQVDYEDRHKDWGYTNAGQICNFETGPYDDVMVHCPLLRTQMESENGLDCASVTMVVQQGTKDPKQCDLTNPNEYECILHSVDESGCKATFVQVRNDWIMESGPGRR